MRQNCMLLKEYYPYPATPPKPHTVHFSRNICGDTTTLGNLPPPLLRVAVTHNAGDVKHEKEAFKISARFQLLTLYAIQTRFVALSRSTRLISSDM
jgi:hypothetical protein